MNIGIFVPSLLATQTDVKLRVTAFRRMLAGRHVVWSQRLILWGAVAVIGAAFAATVGFYAVEGAIYPPVQFLSGLMPGFPDAAVAFTGFASVALIACLGATGLSAAVAVLARRQNNAAGS